ncbi:MAG: TRAP transporter small permease subunit [Alphaproteobacteria bacterium]|nr:MAG: TRAP transporter small permease subunit [Alphaproteobacteria bacterium]
MSLLSRIRQAIDGLTEWIGRGAALLVVPLTLAMSYEVVSRHFFGSPTLWAYELGFMLMGIHFLLAGPAALKHNQHVRIDLLYARFSPRWRGLVDLVLMLTLAIPAVWFIIDRYGAFAWQAFETGERSGQSAWNPPIWPFRFLIVAAFGLLLLQMVATCIRCIEAIAGRRNYPYE